MTGPPGTTGPHGPVLVVDDHELVGTSIVLALRGRGVGAHRCPVTTAEAILAVADEICPLLVLLDLELGAGADDVRVDEIELIRGFSARGRRTLVVSATTDMLRVAAAVAAGATGFVAKSARLDDLLATVGDAAAGRAMFSAAERATWIAVHRQARSVARRRNARLCRLTRREREILGLLARGERAAAIATGAVVSLTTVRSQIRSILTKLEVNSQLEAVALLHDDLSVTAGR